MELSKLFHVLVVAGTMLGSRTCEDEPNNDERADVSPPSHDGAVAPDASDAAGNDTEVGDAETPALDTTVDAAALSPCFCPDTECSDGNVANAGFCCCWGGTPAC